MRGENPQSTQVPVEMQVRKVGKILTANIVDPTTGETQFHIVAPAALKIMLIGTVLGILASVLMLAMIIYNKSEIDELKREVQVQEGLSNDNTQNPVR